MGRMFLLRFFVFFWPIQSLEAVSVSQAARTIKGCGWLGVFQGTLPKWGGPAKHFAFQKEGGFSSLFPLGKRVLLGFWSDFGIPQVGFERLR